MRRILSMIMAVVLAVGFVIPCFAATTDKNVITPRYTYFELLTANFVINENSGISTSTASCYSVSGYTVQIVGKLQRERTNGWTTLKTWTATATEYVEIDQNWALLSGYTYRLYVTYRVLDANGNILETTSTARYYDYY